jgi:hypothetical protein
MAIGVVLLGSLFAACGGSSNSGGSASNGTGANGAGGSSSGSQSTGTSGDGGSFTTGVSSSSSGGETCGGETSKAQAVPLDMYLMLDSSRSMNDLTGTGASKWEAVTQALSAFFVDTGSAGLGVGLQNFPLLVPNVPTSCTSNADCPGTSGPCFLKFCTKEGLKACTSNTDCAIITGNSCQLVGKCGDQICVAGTTCNNGLPCVQVTSSTCAHPDSCSITDYSTPKVEIGQLNDAAGALNTAISAIVPDGVTPTSAALKGAITHAKEWATANPTHEVFVLLATDGLPTECAPTDIASIGQIAADGLSGTPSIKTFVIGVFASTDTGAQANLNAIASSGGTTAFIVDPTKNVEQEFLAALTAIRGTKLACEFNVPTATGTGELDYGKVNVEYTPASATSPTTIGYVTTQQSCDPTLGGWYYDVDPATGATPTKIIMCQATCATFTAQTGGQVDIRVGCKTVVQPPPK